jgi:hypothetical protein
VARGGQRPVRAVAAWALSETALGNLDRPRPL